MFRTMNTQIIQKLNDFIAEQNVAVRHEGNNSSKTGWLFSCSGKAREMIEALQGNKALAFTGFKKVILVFGISSLPENVLQKFVEHWLKGKSHSNLALTTLAGIPAVIRSNTKGSAWIVVLGSGDPIAVSDMEWKTIPCQNTTNGAGHWVAICNKTLANERLKSLQSTQLSSAKREFLKKISD